MKIGLSTSVSTSILLPLLWLAEGTASGQLWQVTSAPFTNWTCMAMSADGSRLVAGTAAGYSTPGPLFVSTNSGVTWTQNAAPLLRWRSIAASADGTKFIAAEDGGGIYTSSDSGGTWKATGATVALWQSVASSADGLRLIAAETNTASFYGFIHSSANGGTTWDVTAAPSFPWLSVANSANGTKLAATGHNFRGNPANVFVSADAGASWVPVSDDWWWYYKDPVSIASTADGETLLAGTYVGVYVSTNCGAGWTRSLLPANQIFATACSADGGQMLVAAFAGGETGALYTSTNRGTVWWSVEAPLASWCAVGCSADGSTLAAAARNGGVYISRVAPHPVLGVERTVSNVNLFWLTPSMPFGLQQTASLAEPQWADIEAQPTLNCTNLNQEVSLPATNAPTFYRLISR